MAILEEVFDAGINLLRGAIGSFGTVVFEVYSSSYPRVEYDTELQVRAGTRVMTFDNFQRRTRARYARHEVIGKTSRLEKVGDEPDQITLEVKLIRELGVVPEDEIEQIREYIKAGTCEPLIIGSEVIGQFVISELSERREFVDCFGRTLVAEVSLTFEEEQDDDLRADTRGNDLGTVPVIWN